MAGLYALCAVELPDRTADIYGSVYLFIWLAMVRSDEKLWRRYPIQSVLAEVGRRWSGAVYMAYVIRAPTVRTTTPSALYPQKSNCNSSWNTTRMSTKSSFPCKNRNAMNTNWLTVKEVTSVQPVMVCVQPGRIRSGSLFTIFGQD